MAVIEIRLNGTDITSDVIFKDASFTSMANGNVGPCSFRVRDLLHVYSTIRIGDEITLDIDGVRAWGGFVKQLRRGYFFEARDCECPETTPIYYQIIGSDYNVLLNQRYLFDPDNPEATQLHEFPAGTPDNEVIDYYVTNYLDLSGDGIDTSTLVEHVGTPSLDTPINGAVGMSWNQFMAFIAYNTGSIWYLDPDKKLVYCDVDTPNAPYEISDNPDPGQVGPREYRALFDGTRLRNDALVWGVGKGSANAVFARVTDTTSVANHNLWQVGRVVGGIWKQDTADRTANTYVNGSPQGKRGGKMDRHSIDAVVFEPGLRVAQKVHAYFQVFGYNEIIPIRVLQITFPTDQDPKYQITLAHEIDEPEDLTDPLPDNRPYQVCTNIHCGPFLDGDWDVGALGVSSTSLTQPLGSLEVQDGHNSWTVFVPGGTLHCQPNMWQWLADNTAKSSGTYHGRAHVELQWADLYGYTVLPGQLCEKGEAGWEVETGWKLETVPAANALPGTTAASWNGLVTMTFTVTGTTYPRPRPATRPLFPFTAWPGVSLVAQQGVAFGLISPSDLTLTPIDSPFGTTYNVPPTIWPYSVISTEGTTVFRDEGIYVRGERFVGYATPDVEYTVTFATGTFPAGSQVWLYGYLPFIDFANAAGRVEVNYDFTIDWRPAPSGGAVIPNPDIGDCVPRCITIGSNCEQATRLGRRSYQTLGLYSVGSTQVWVNGVGQALGSDYTESDPENGVITFTYDIATDAFVYVCYYANTLANQLPSYAVTDNVLQVPIHGVGITGTFGPQLDFWPPMVWHGVYYPHFHNGVDFGAVTGTPVYASADGIVQYEDQAAGGTMIHIYHDSPATPIPMRTTYAHLSQRVVPHGAAVSQGDHIAYSGSSGDVTGPHLHWGVDIYGWPEDPLPWSNTPRTTAVL